MQGVKPCPCGGEVEVIKLNRKPTDEEQYYRIECKRCHALVARGIHFPKESYEDGMERIRQYEALMEERLKNPKHTQFILSAAGKRHNLLKAKATMMSPEDTW